MRGKNVSSMGVEIFLCFHFSNSVMLDEGNKKKHLLKHVKFYWCFLTDCCLKLLSTDRHKEGYTIKILLIVLSNVSNGCHIFVSVFGRV
jgi:hypothetical protein